jgi:RHS repeat-associated protein
MPPTGTPTYTYAYDRFGNRWQQNSPSGAIYTSSFTFTGNGGNNTNRMDTYSYDSAGNLLFDNAHHYFYDAENRLIQVDGTLPYCTSNGSSGSAATACYYYDANGRRVHRTGYTNDTCDNTGKRDYVFDLAGRVIVENNSTGTACDIQVYAGERHFGRQGGGSFFYHSDWLGTVRLINSDADPTYGAETCTSLPFGDGLTCNSNYNNVWHFTGKERDYESGLDNFGARYNSSSMGRFVSADPITVTPGRMADPQQLNLYSYVKNNPLAFTDPTGMIIDTSDLSDQDKKLWQKVVDLANQQDANGNYVNATLHDAYSKLDSDSRVFKIEDDKSLGQNESGRFEITKFNGANDFSEAKVELNFGAIKGIGSTTKGDFDSSFNKYEGLFGKNGFINRLAETFGHEAGGHGLFALHDPAFAVYTQKLLNDINPAILAANRARTPLPPDLQQKVQQRDLVLIPSERFAQQQEKIVNGELRATHP